MVHWNNKLNFVNLRVIRNKDVRNFRQRKAVSLTKGKRILKKILKKTIKLENWERTTKDLNGLVKIPLKWRKNKKLDKKLKKKTNVCCFLPFCFINIKWFYLIHKHLNKRNLCQKTLKQMSPRLAQRKFLFLFCTKPNLFFFFR